MEDMGSAIVPANHKKSKKRKKHKPKKPSAQVEISSPDGELNCFESPTKTEEVDCELGAVCLGRQVERLLEGQNSVSPATTQVSALPSGLSLGSVALEEQHLLSRTSNKPWLHHSCHKENNLNRAVEENHCNNLTENTAGAEQLSLPDSATIKQETNASSVAERKVDNGIKTATFETSKKNRSNLTKVTASHHASVELKEDSSEKTNLNKVHVTASKKASVEFKVDMSEKTNLKKITTSKKAVEFKEDMSEKTNLKKVGQTTNKKASVESKDDGLKVKDLKIPEGTVGDSNQKTKAQLKAERKAAFEARHSEQLIQKPKVEKNKAERRALQEAQRAQKSKGIDSKEDGKGTPQVSDASKASSTNEGSNHRISQSPKKAVEKKVVLERPPKSGQKKARLFSHLPQYQWDEDLTADLRMSSNTIHPAVIRVGLQIAQGLVTGSNARSVAMLLAFQQVIKDYDTPPQKELSRDLEAKLQPYVSFLNKCRPLSAGMENEVKKLKWEINHIPPNMSETKAKDRLCEIIETNITNDITLAQRAICLSISSKILDRDVILTYSCSSVVKIVLADAHSKGRRFQVIVVDSRPRLEGREMVRYLVKKGIPCSYMLINAVSYVMKEVTKVILGAYSLQANGYVMSRVGSSQIALIARASNVQVLVCCETYKFCEQVHTDSFVYNELGNPNDLVTTTPPHKCYLENWKEISSLRLLNLTYDVTPPNLVTAVITDLGMLPCTSVPVVLRVKHAAVQEQ